MHHPMPTLIAVHGLKYAGKGSVAGRLISHHGFTLAKFAAAIKDMVAVALTRSCGMDDATVARCIEGDLKETTIPALNGKSCRYLMQVIGCEFRDAVERSMWTCMAMQVITKARSEGHRVVVDDLRFMHEVDRLRTEGAGLWMVERDPVSTPGWGGSVPWNTEATPWMGLDEQTLDMMLATMLTHCGALEHEVAETSRGKAPNRRMDILGGNSPAHCASTLRSVVVPLIMLPAKVDTTTTAAHVSEKPLPRELFQAIIVNDGSLEDLTRKVDYLVTES